MSTQELINSTWCMTCPFWFPYRLPRSFSDVKILKCIGQHLGMILSLFQRWCWNLTQESILSRRLWQEEILDPVLWCHFISPCSTGSALSDKRGLLHMCPRTFRELAFIQIYSNQLVSRPLYPINSLPIYTYPCISMS